VFGMTSYWVEKTATIRQRFRVPADAKAGKLTVRGGVDYTACTPDFCDPPATATFEATLTVGSGSGSAAAPAVRSGDGKLQVSARIEPAGAHPGDKVQLIVGVEVAKGWHVYGSSETNSQAISLSP